MSLSPFWTASAVILLAFGFASPAMVPAAPATHAGPNLVGTPPAGAGLPGILPNDHLQHIITIVMENHDYDSFFGNYCQVEGPYCSSIGNGIPAGTCVPKIPTDPSYGCIAPFNLTMKQLTVPDMQHDWVSGPKALDGGAMDGFYSAEGTNLTFGHYNASVIPIYWDMAEEYASSDNFWAGNLSYSLPNHWELVAGQAPPITYDSYLKTLPDRTTYRTQANNTSTIQDLLNQSSVSWRYYDFTLAPESLSFAANGFGTAYDYWNPLAGRAESYNAHFSPHFVPRTQILTDLTSGGLPNVSWVIPSAPQSDHPGYNATGGEAWVAQLVNAVEASSYWNSTAIFVTWDDYGGWYDHVAPPKVLQDVLSFRAPILVISPYARENFISHAPLNFFSLLKFIEWQFGLKCLTPLDCLATLPLDFFDFNQAPRPPILFPTSWLNATYPMPLQQPGVADIDCTACLQVDLSSWQNAVINPAETPITDWS